MPDNGEYGLQFPHGPVLEVAEMWADNNKVRTTSKRYISRCKHVRETVAQYFTVSIDRSGRRNYLQADENSRAVPAEGPNKSPTTLCAATSLAYIQYSTVPTVYGVLRVPL